MKQYLIGKNYARTFGYDRIAGYTVMHSDISNWEHGERDGKRLILLKVPDHESFGSWFIAEDDLVPMTNAGNAYRLNKEAYE